ncbi:SigE family RNA polymerase sigma factor [Actinomycetes bacterium KLBMP 9797]
MAADEDQEYVAYVSAASSRLRHSAYLLCGDPHRADDIVQATLVAVYLKWSRIRDVGNIDGYVHRILVRRYLDETRRSWAKVLLSWRTPETPARPGPSVEDADVVRSALAELTPGQRSVLVLRFFADLSVEQTAAALGCSTANVTSQTSRGIARMRQLLAERWPGGTRPSTTDRSV